MSKSAFKYSKEFIVNDYFDLAQTLNCGQCFRFAEVEKDVFGGVALDKYLEFTLNQNKLTVFSNSEFSEEEILNFFDLNRNYTEINTILSADETLKNAIEYAGGIRILTQPKWETLCSFILSQNNNIKRITGIIDRLCQNFGSDLGNGKYSFPSAERLAGLTVEDLEPLRSGFRAKYVLDAAKKVHSKEVDFDKIDSASIDEAREMLMAIQGVGPKVADCVLLFGFHKLDAFPKDVWIKKVMQEFYPDGLPDYAVKYGGIAQQYLFHYMRTKLN